METRLQRRRSGPASGTGRATRGRGERSVKNRPCREGKSVDVPFQNAQTVDPRFVHRPETRTRMFGKAGVLTSARRGSLPGGGFRMNDARSSKVGLPLPRLTSISERARSVPSRGREGFSKSPLKTKVPSRVCRPLRAHREKVCCQSSLQRVKRKGAPRDVTVTVVPEARFQRRPPRPRPRARIDSEGQKDGLPSEPVPSFEGFV